MAHAPLAYGNHDSLTPVETAYVLRALRAAGMDDAAAWVDAIDVARPTYYVKSRLPGGHLHMSSISMAEGEQLAVWHCPGNERWGFHGCPGAVGTAPTLAKGLVNLVEHHHDKGGAPLPNPKVLTRMRNAAA